MTHTAAYGDGSSAPEAVPKKAHEPELEGPFVAKLSKTDIQANLAGADGKRYVVMSLQAEYYAYDESYVQGRLGGGAGGGGHGGASAEALQLFQNRCRNPRANARPISIAQGAANGSW